MSAPEKYRHPTLFPTWYRHGNQVVTQRLVRGFPDPEDAPDVRCEWCGADLIDYDRDHALEAGLPSCRDAGRSW